MLGLTPRGQQIFNMRLGPQWSHPSLGDGGKYHNTLWAIWFHRVRTDVY